MSWRSGGKLWRGQYGRGNDEDGEDGEDGEDSGVAEELMKTKSSSRKTVEINKGGNQREPASSDGLTKNWNQLAGGLAE